VAGAAAGLRDIEALGGYFLYTYPPPVVDSEKILNDWPIAKLLEGAKNGATFESLGLEDNEETASSPVDEGASNEQRATSDEGSSPVDAGMGDRQYYPMAAAITRIYYFGSGMDHKTPAGLVNTGFTGVREVYMQDPTNVDTFLAGEFHRDANRNRVTVVESALGNAINITLDSRRLRKNRNRGSKKSFTWF